MQSRPPQPQLADSGAVEDGNRRPFAPPLPLVHANTDSVMPASHPPAQEARRRSHHHHHRSRNHRGSYQQPEPPVRRRLDVRSDARDSSAGSRAHESGGHRDSTDTARSERDAAAGGSEGHGHGQRRRRRRRHQQQGDHQLSANAATDTDRDSRRTGDSDSDGSSGSNSSFVSRDSKRRPSTATAASSSVPSRADELDLYEETARARRETDMKLQSFLPLRRGCYLFFQRIETPYARAFAALSLLCIVIALVVDCIRSYGPIEARRRLDHINRLLPCDAIVAAVFTIDFCGRFYGAIDRAKFWKSIVNVADFITIWPFYLELIFANEQVGFMSVIGTLKAARIVQVVRLARFSIGLQIAIRAVFRSLEAFAILVMYAVFAIVIYSAAMYFAERGTLDMDRGGVWMRENGQPSPFQSIPDGFYWAVTTLSTTGYGDMTPVTTIGKIISGFTMFTGVTLLALPVSIIGSNFMSEWLNYQRLQLQRKARQSSSDPSADDGAMSDYDDADGRRAARQRYIRRSKAEQIASLESRCDAMQQIVSEVQDHLADINPPQYYLRYKAFQKRHAEAMARIEELERECEKWRHIAKSFASYPSSSYGSRGSQASRRPLFLRNSLLAPLTSKVDADGVASTSAGAGSDSDNQHSGGGLLGALPLIRHFSRGNNDSGAEDDRGRLSEERRDSVDGTGVDIEGNDGPGRPLRKRLRALSTGLRSNKKRPSEDPDGAQVSQATTTIATGVPLFRSITDGHVSLSSSDRRTSNGGFLQSITSRLFSGPAEGQSSYLTSHATAGATGHGKKKPGKLVISGPVAGSAVPMYTRIEPAGGTSTPAPSTGSGVAGERPGSATARIRFPDHDAGARGKADQEPDEDDLGQLLQEWQASGRQFPESVMRMEEDVDASALTVPATQRERQQHAGRLLTTLFEAPPTMPRQPERTAAQEEECSPLQLSEATLAEQQ
ncbi:hypothetical protein RI367_004690 [Sorochytrium milnesiophthora]